MNTHKRYQFDPFNLGLKKQREEHQIKFDRLPNSRKLKPILWLVILFCIIAACYWYLTENFK